MLYTYRNELHQEFHDLLCAEATKRPERREGISWIDLERKAMFEAVNRHRKALNKENMAFGHSDYGTKYALYCTELVQNTP